MLGQFKQRTFFFPLKTTGRHSFINQKKKEGHDKCSKSSGEIRCRLAAFSHHALLLRWGGQDRITLCVLEPLIFFFFEMFHLLIVPFFDFFLIVLRCETVSPPGRSTHSVREKRLTFNSKTSSGNINHVINEKKKSTSFNLFIYTFYTTVVITLGVFLLFLF